MKSNLYSILAIALLSGCTSTQINSSVNNDKTTKTKLEKMKLFEKSYLKFKNKLRNEATKYI